MTRRRGHPAQSYLNLLKRSLNGYLQVGGKREYANYSACNPDNYDWENDCWRLPEPAVPQSLLSAYQFENLEELMVDTIKRKVPGDYFEAGVCRGGAVIFMRALLKAYGVRKKVWVADSFEGIPQTRNKNGHSDPVDDWANRWVATLDAVKNNFRRYDLLDDGVVFLKGYFAKSLRTKRIGKLALLRLDADAYESTMDALTALYPKVSPGGYVIIDDFHLPSCRQAVEEYRQAHGVTAPYIGVYGTDSLGKHRLREVYWKKAK